METKRGEESCFYVEDRISSSFQHGLSFLLLGAADFLLLMEDQVKEG